MNKIKFKNLPDTSIPINDDNLNLMQDNIEESIRGARSLVTLTEEIPQNTDYTIPFSYIVGSNDLSVYYEGVLCIKNKDYIEVGTAGKESTTIQLKDWQR